MIPVVSVVRRVWKSNINREKIHCKKCNRECEIQRIKDGTPLWVRGGMRGAVDPACVSRVGRDEAAIRDCIRNQQKEDACLEQPEIFGRD